MAAWSVLAVLVAIAIEADGQAQPAGMIISIQGPVEVERAGRASPAAARQELLVGDVVRTGPGGRAALLLADESRVKLNANSTLRLKGVAPRPARGVVPVAARVGKTLLEILLGEIWVQTDGPPDSLEIETPAVTATIRGTELNVRVAPDGESRLGVISGQVQFANPQGSILLNPGELGIARRGQPPLKQVLLRPEDAVQWTLYYGGQVSYRDYPLVTADRTRLESVLPDAFRAVAASPGDADAQVRLGEILHDLGRRDLARAAFTDALRVRPGDARALAGLGWLALEDGRADEGLAHFGAVSPPMESSVLGLSLARFAKGEIEAAQAALDDGRRRLGPSAALSTQQALFDLLRGDVPGAREAIDEALRLDPGDARAHGLRSNIALVQNRTDEAFAAAQQAVRANPASSSAQLDLSYAHQARFELDRALEAARRAVAADPANARAHVQLARLLMGYSRLEGFDRVEEAWRAAQQALRLDPRDPLVHATVGFLQLARDHVRGAIASFEKAIELGATFGDPYIGLGLAAFRQGRREEGLRNFQAAVLMDSRVSLFHSYVGKALYDLGRRQEALAAFQRARQLDPRDPTPDLYEGIALTDLNRPADAIAALQRSIRLNDNRAVYSSRLLLDQDLALRNVNLIRSYFDLSQNFRAGAKTIQALHEDPRSSTAHLDFAAVSGFLGGAQATASELLQARLLVPVTYNALAEGIFPRGSQWTVMLDRPALEGALIVTGGTFDTLDTGLGVAGATVDRARVTGGTLLTYAETDGPKRHNSDQEAWAGAAFVKWAPDYRSSLFAHLFHAERRSGDISQDQRFFTGNDPAFRANRQSTFLGLGYQIKPVPEGDLLLYVQGQYAERARATTRGTVVTTEPGLEFLFPDVSRQISVEGDLRTDQPFVDFQTAYLHKLRHHQLWLAGDYFFGEPQSVDRTAARVDTLFSGIFAGIPPINRLTFDSDLKQRFDRQYVSLVAQDVWQVVPSLFLTAALRYDHARDGDLFSKRRDNYSVVSPQGGLLWRVTPEHTLRLAAFQHFATQLHAVISPTHIAGFFLDPPSIPGTTSVQYHAAWEAEITPRTFFTLAGFRRESDIPLYETTADGRRERNFKAVARTGFAAITEQMLWRYFGVQALYALINREGPFEHNGNDHLFGASANLVYPFGFDAGAIRLTAVPLYVSQDLGAARHPRAPRDYWVARLGAAYEFPDKLGAVEIRLENAFNTRFDYQNPGSRTGNRDDLGLPVLPERLVLVTLRLRF